MPLFCVSSSILNPVIQYILATKGFDVPLTNSWVTLKYSHFWIHMLILPSQPMIHTILNDKLFISFCLTSLFFLFCKYISSYTTSICSNLVLLTWSIDVWDSRYEILDVTDYELWIHGHEDTSTNKNYASRFQCKILLFHRGSWYSGTGNKIWSILLLFISFTL